MTETTKARKPKQPQDRKPKASSTKPKDDVLSVEYLDHEWTVSTDSLDDFELLEALDDIENGAVQRIPSAMRRLLGPEQYLTAKDLIRDSSTGKISVESGMNFFLEIFTRADKKTADGDDE